MLKRQWEKTKQMSSVPERRKKRVVVMLEYYLSQVLLSNKRLGHFKWDLLYRRCSLLIHEVFFMGNSISLAIILHWLAVYCDYVEIKSVLFISVLTHGRYIWLVKQLLLLANEMRHKFRRFRRSRGFYCERCWSSLASSRLKDTMKILRPGFRIRRRGHDQLLSGAWSRKLVDKDI